MAHLILFSDAGFRGEHKHVLEPVSTLNLLGTDAQGHSVCVADCDWPNSVSSIVVLSGNWQFFLREGFEIPLGPILGPGLYRYVETYKLPNDNIRAMRPVDASPTMSGEPLNGYVTLFENHDFRGKHLHLFETQGDIGAIDGDMVAETTSIVVDLGNWSFYSDQYSIGSYAGYPILGPGIYQSVEDVGIKNDTIVSLELTVSPATVGNAVDNHVILFEYSELYGAHRHVMAAEPNLNADDDDYFNDNVGSVAILSGSWLFYADADYGHLYDTTPAFPGNYLNLATLNVSYHEMSSLRPPSTESIRGEIILFHSDNFRGPHKHVINAESNLNAGEDDSFNDDISSFVIIQGNWKFYRDAEWVNDYPAVLGPGLYPSVEAVKIKDNDMSSLRVVDEAPTPGMAVAPIENHIILFEHANGRGDHRHLFEKLDVFAWLDESLDSFHHKTSSMVVLAGIWQTFSNPVNTPVPGDATNPFPTLLGGPGVYSSMPDSNQNDNVGSLQPVVPDPFQVVARGGPLLGHALLFEHAHLRGAHKHIINAEDDLNNDEDDSFNDETSSLVLFPNDNWTVSWQLFADSIFGGQKVTLGVGRYDWVEAAGVPNDTLSSLIVTGDRMEFVGSVTLTVKSGSLPDPVVGSVDMTFIYLSTTNALLLEKPFEPLDDHNGHKVYLNGMGTGVLPPDGAIVIQAVQTTVTADLGLSSIVVANPIFDLTTGMVTSPNNDYTASGSPLNFVTREVKLVGAGRSNDDDFKVEMVGTLSPIT